MKRSLALMNRTVGLLVMAGVLAVSPAPAQDKDQTWDHPLPFGAKWALSRGIDLPNPFGISVFMVSMSRAIEVYDVRVTLPGNAPVSISDIASFDVGNFTTVASVKLDAWILPILNLYVLGGHTWTDTQLDVAITLDRLIGDPVVIEATQNTKVGGPMFGAGATVVAGAGPWFIMADANYIYSKIKAFDGGIGAWFLSARTGWSGSLGKGVWRAWIGPAYLVADRTLAFMEESPVLGPVTVEVDQRPLNPWTLEFGGSIDIGKSWTLLLEIGSNFGDAVLGVLTAAYRF